MGETALAGVKRHLRRRWADLRLKFLTNIAFVHINKTAGTSIAGALGLPWARHRTALEYVDLLGRDRWDARFTFTFVRNPWDKVVSHYHYRVKTNRTGLAESPVPFGEWVRLAYGDQDPRYLDNPKMFMPQVDWISDAGGHILVDFIGRFERIQEDFDEVCTRTGRRAELPHLKRSSHVDYREYYESDTADVVASWFAKDIRMFGYRFDKPVGDAEPYKV